MIWDDYGSFQCEGVATLGRELFASDLEAGRLVHNINGHLLLFKLADAPLPPLARRRPERRSASAGEAASVASASPRGEPIS